MCYRTKFEMSQHLNQKKLEISYRFALLRKHVGNQTELAKLLGISSDYVSMIETGKREPGPRLLKDFEEIERKFGLAKSETSDSVMSPLELKEDPPEYGVQSNWQRRAEEAEAENQKLKQAIRALIGDDPESKPNNQDKQK